jgi:hypothetical protein
MRIISYKLHGNNPEIHICGIDNKVTHKDLIGDILNENSNLTGWIKIHSLKLSFKKGKLHGNKNNPAVKEGKSLRLFIDNGKLQTYRHHDVPISDILHMEMTAYEEHEVNLWDMFNEHGQFDMSGFYYKYFTNDEFPVASSKAVGDYYIFDGYNLFVEYDRVSRFKVRNNIDKLSKEDISVLVFETTMERAR